MMYQDVWINGRLVQVGYRSCEPRYRIIHEFCSVNLGIGFRVCDIGANMAYFSIRLIEDFKATAVAFEFHQFDKRAAIVKKQRTGRFMYINRKLCINDLLVMREICRFDLVLGMSVLHHVRGHADQWVEAMRAMSRFTIIEVALEDSKRATKKGITVPDGGEIIGYGDSHLKQGFRRPIIAYRNERSVL